MEKQTKGQEPNSLADCPEFLALNPKQQKFVIVYISCGVAEKAYIEAGYSPNGAPEGASRLLSNVKVQAAVAVARRIETGRLCDKYGITKQKILTELSRVAFSNLKNVATWEGQSCQLKNSEDIPDEDAAAIKSITCSSSSTSKGDSVSMSVALHDKVKALHLLANMKGMLDGADDDKERKPIDKSIKDRLHRLRAKYIAGRK
jgi:hypothetical protein